MINGVINLNKPKGKTSHDMIYFMRRMSMQKRVGHTGTLDPDATGVLPVCLGIATKASDYIQEGTKAYRAHIHFGLVTSTQDISGEVLKENDTKNLTEDMFKETIKSFIGDIEQIPPMYSAIKVNGKKLYELARKGIEIERKSRKVTIYSIEISEFNKEEKYAVIDVCCSKGTYIRTLCADIGEKMGFGACMGELVRTKSGNFLIEESHSIEEIEKMASEGRLSELVIPTDKLFEGYTPLTVSGKDEFYVKNGRALEGYDYPEGERFLIYDSSGKFLCISEMKDKKIKMLTSFWSD